MKCFSQEEVKVMKKRKKFYKIVADLMFITFLLNIFVIFPGITGGFMCDEISVLEFIIFEIICAGISYLSYLFAIFYQKKSDEIKQLRKTL